jgi:hypothetical protein
MNPFDGVGPSTRLRTGGVRLSRPGRRVGDIIEGTGWQKVGSDLVENR